VGGAALGFTNPWQKFLTCAITAPWLPPAESDLYWMIPAAPSALIPAYFLASWGIEYRVMQALVWREPCERKAPVLLRKSPLGTSTMFYGFRRKPYLQGF
jgi:hypothetical protein